MRTPSAVSVVSIVPRRRRRSPPPLARPSPCAGRPRISGPAYRSAPPRMPKTTARAGSVEIDAARQIGSPINITIAMLSIPA